MTFKLKWDEIGERTYETGINRGVLYDMDGKGYAWSGLTKFEKSPSGAEPNRQYSDNIVYLVLNSAEEFGGNIEAFAYPKEFKLCNGVSDLAPGVSVGQQNRQPFSFSYRSIVGNDLKKNAFGYKIHIIYGAMAQPSPATYETVNNDPTVISFSWDITCTPVNITGFEPSAELILDSTTMTPEQMALIENVLYGSDTTEAKLLYPDEILALLQIPTEPPVEG